MKYLAIDPGQTNGVAFYNGTTFSALQLDMKPFSKPHKEFYEFLEHYEPEYLIYESFYFRQGKTGADYTPVEYISLIKLYSETYNCNLIPMNPSTAKGFWTDAKVKAVGLWIPGLKHGMDATRILLHHIMSVDEKLRLTFFEMIRSNMK